MLTVPSATQRSGASAGEFEALELRDDKSDSAKALAIANINEKIAPALAGIDASDIYAVDKAMIDLDGTKDKSSLGANTFWQFPFCFQAAAGMDIPLYRFFGLQANKLRYMMNILNGSARGQLC